MGFRTVLGAMAGIALMAFSSFSVAASANDPPVAAAAPDSPASGQGPGAAPDADLTDRLSCKPGAPASSTAANMKYVVQLDSSTTWQPRDGEVKFTIEAPISLPASIRVATCFGWPRENRNSEIDWVRGAPVRVLAIDQRTITLAARVPNLRSASSGWLTRIFGKGQGRYTGLDVVPVSDFRILADLPESVLDIAIPIGVTSRSYSLILAISILIFALMLCYFASMRRIPGRNLLLQIISTSSGYASLSQLQIVVWTYVIGGSAMYVMALSGNLIDISQTTLILLGISGLTTVGSKLQSYREDAASTLPPLSQAVPGAVGSLALSEDPSGFELRLVWLPPDGGEPVLGYRVMSKASGSQLWQVRSENFSGRRFAFVGLEPATPYDFRIQAINQSGAGAATELSVTTAPSGVAQAAPAAVQGLAADGDSTGSTVRLRWLPLPGTGITYVVQYRAGASDENWRNASGPADKTSFTVNRLFANTQYNFRIVGRNDLGLGVPSSVISASTGVREPKWSDLIIPNDHKQEIDVTRVQMLFFTMVSAIFVGMRVLVSDEVPDLPEGFLALMGISNGVYLTAKFVPR